MYTKTMTTTISHKRYRVEPKSATAPLFMVKDVADGAYETDSLYNAMNMIRNRRTAYYYDMNTGNWRARRVATWTLYDNDDSSRTYHRFYADGEATQFEINGRSC